MPAFIVLGDLTYSGGHYSAFKNWLRLICEFKLTWPHPKRKLNWNDRKNLVILFYFISIKLHIGTQKRSNCVLVCIILVINHDYFSLICNHISNIFTQTYINLHIYRHIFLYCAGNEVFIKVCIYHIKKVVFYFL